MQLLRSLIPDKWLLTRCCFVLQRHTMFSYPLMPIWLRHYAAVRVGDNAAASWPNQPINVISFKKKNLAPSAWNERQAPLHSATAHVPSRTQTRERIFDKSPLTGLGANFRPPGQCRATRPARPGEKH